MVRLPYARRALLQGAAWFALLGHQARAEDQAKPVEKPDSKKPDAKADAKTDSGPPKAPKSVTREFSGTFHGERLTYNVTAGEIFLKNDKGEPTASIFSTTYVKKGIGDAAQRPGEPS